MDMLLRTIGIASVFLICVSAVQKFLVGQLSQLR